MSILGLIPARGNSKRLPGKNIADLGGKPLLAWTIESARESKLFDRVVVSSEDVDVGNTALKYGAEWLKRPMQLSQDETPSMEVVRHAVGNDPYEMVVLLQPTSPFRTAEDIRNSVTLLQANLADAVVSVTDPPVDLVFEIGHAGRIRRATRATVVPNGALFLLTTEAMRAGMDWWTGLTYAYHMPRERSIDIDTAMDLEMARSMLTRSAVA